MATLAAFVVLVRAPAVAGGAVWMSV